MTPSLRCKHTYPEISLDSLRALFKRRLSSHSRRIEQHTLQRPERLDLLERAVQLLQIRDIADPGLDAATVTALLDRIEHAVFILGETLLVPGDQGDVGEATD